MPDTDHLSQKMDNDCKVQEVRKEIERYFACVCCDGVKRNALLVPPRPPPSRQPPPPPRAARAASSSAQAWRAVLQPGGVVMAEEA
ncbi:hypothetical protein GN956_G24735 [Arapaima gigas]